jgi:hypothetical protein
METTNLQASESVGPFRKISGRFFRSILSDRVDRILAPPDAESAGRYHRLGEPTLYMSPLQDWAIMAIAGYMREDHRRRVVVPLLVSDALVVDQRDERACKELGIDRALSNEPWRPALAAGLGSKPDQSIEVRKQIRFKLCTELDDGE